MRHSGAIAGVVVALVLQCGAVKADDEQSLPTYLNQNWTSQERSRFYFTPQGSYLLPLAWFLALERADSAKSFNSPEHIERLGFLNDEDAYGPANPDGLPIGFAEEPMADGESWVGLTCAACHTGEIRYRGQTVRIDGAPTLGDFTALSEGLEAALQATLDQPGKFRRFARAVLHKPRKAEREALKSRVQERLTWLQQYNDRSAPAYPYGYGRVDAFGIIMNEVFGREMHVPDNLRVPAAPVSYPCLWTTPQEDWVQWNGSANNPFGRNLGEVLGTYGSVNLTDPATLGKSSARPRELFELERLVAKLTPPQWPEAVLGAIDHAKAARGRELYLARRGDEPSCAECHALSDGDGHYPMTPAAENRFGAQFIETRMVPLADIGTDPLMATNFATRSVATGDLATLLGGQTQLPAPALLSKLMGIAVASAMASADPAFTDAEKHELIGYRLRTDGEPYRPRNLMAYRARSLDGIWATAPYLHNGSVPSLYQLLVPPAQRQQRFYMGSHRFDPVDVGYRNRPDALGFEFDATLPGNFNGGHDYGTDLTEAERRDLIEFLKTL
ncbi:MAG: cytochrome C [Methylococcaceae bacterium]|nr:cytochrome C [Methylococcaceae bacterium]